MATALKQGYIVDGKIFDTAQEARDFQRMPQVKAALFAISGKNQDFADFLYENQEAIEAANDQTIKRVTKSERKAIAKAFAELLAVNNGKLKFLQDNAQAFIDSFKWPLVNRLKPEEKVAKTKEALTKLADEKVADWIVANYAALQMAYEAGVEKRAAPAGSGLAEYLAAKKAGPEALAAYQVKKAAEKAAKASA